MKKIIAIIISAVLVFSALAFPVSAESEKVSDFAGKRQVEYVIDNSDLENYFNGGRSFFELILRSYSPEWLKYSIETANRDVTIALEFSFNSLDEYRSRIGELISATPYVNYSKTKSSVLFLESHTAAEMLTFIYAPAAGAVIYEDITLDTLFRVSKNAITINGKEYLGEQKLNILPEGEAPITFSELSIETSYGKNGFTRTVRAFPQNYDDFESLVVRFKSVGKTSSFDNTATVSFSAYSLADLNNLTSRCLYVPCNVLESEEYLKGITVGVTQTELFGLESIMSEYGKFSFSYKCPSYYSKLKAIDETVTVSGSTITAENVSSVQYYYERDFAFSGLDIKTDFSDIWGKGTKVITLSAPKNRVLPLHEELKKHFEKFLDDGITLDIYDSGANRYYSFSYSSWLGGGLTDFAEELLGETYEGDISDSWFPYGPGSIEESLNFNELALIGSPPSNVTATYVFPSASSYERADGPAVTDEENHTIVSAVSALRTVTIEYNRFHLAKCIFFLVILIGVAIGLLFAIKFLKRKLAQYKEERQQQRDAEMQNPEYSQPPAVPYNGEYEQVPPTDTPIEDTDAPTAPTESEPPQAPSLNFCPSCGAPVSVGTGFCGKCGTKLN